VKVYIHCIAVYGILNKLCHLCTARIKTYDKLIRVAVASDKVYQLLSHGRWYSPATPASSTTKTGRHDIAEILLKVVLKHQTATRISFIFFLAIGQKLKCRA
jgi:hypothetical protein